MKVIIDGKEIEMSSDIEDYEIGFDKLNISESEIIDLENTIEITEEELNAIRENTGDDDE